MIEFRRTLASSFLFKFFIHVMSSVAGSLVADDEKSAGAPYQVRPSSLTLNGIKKINRI